MKYKSSRVVPKWMNAAGDRWINRSR